MPIALAEPDSGWPSAYARARDEILDAVGSGAFLGFEHIGSTSVPGLAAKPLIDMMAAVASLDAVDPLVGSIEALGYEYLQELSLTIPGRRMFERRDAHGVPIEHLHVVVYEGTNWKRHKDFRDWLRGHPEDRRAYEDLKRVLAAQYDDTRKYSAAKTAFIRDIEVRAARADPS